jgi:hypothetical protein
MPNEVMIKIKVKDETDFEPALLKAREFGAKLKEELEKAGRAAGDDAADEIKRQLEELDVPTIDLKVDSEEAKAEIHEVKDDLERLNEYGDDIEIDVHLNDETAKVEAKVLEEKLKHELSDVGAGSASSFGKSFTNALSKVDFAPGLMPVGIALGVALSPLLAASAAGAIVGGLGLGGIIGGVLIAAKDPRVKSAFGDLKSDLGDALELDAAPFVPVVESGIKGIKVAFDQIDLKGIFANLAPQVTPVLNGILDLIVSLGGALKDISVTSGPVLAELGDDFRNLGTTLKDAFDSLTDNSEQEAQALHDLFGILDGSITVVFQLVNALTELYGAFHAMEAVSLVGGFTALQDGSQGVTDAVKAQVGAVIDAANANGDLSDSARTAAAANKEEADSIKTVATELKKSTDPAFALLDAQDQVTKAQSAYNKAVKTGGQNSDAARKAQTSLEKAMITYVTAAGNARSGTGHLTAEQTSLLKAAGASDKTIRGLNASLKKAYDASKKLDGFDIDINVTTHFKQTGKYISQSQIDNPSQLYSGLSHGGVSAAANGSTSSGLTWVNERGPELMKLPPGTSVRTAGDSARDVAAAMGGSGGNGVARIWFDKASLSGLAAALMETLRGEIRGQGGNVQQALGQAGR